MAPRVRLGAAAVTGGVRTANDTTVPEGRPTAPLFSAPIGPFVSSLPRAANAPVGLADTRAVRAVIERYQDALNDLDATAAKAVWPSVDEKGLGRAFGQLERQQVTLDSCDVAVVGVRAEASCGGRASYVPKIGHKTARIEPRRWAFTLRHIADGWMIVTVQSSTSR